MKTILLVLAVAISCAYAASLISDEQYLGKFVEFQHKFNKTYKAAEFGKRFAIFKANLEKAAIRNSNSKSARYGMTKFSDLTDEEFAKFYLLPKFTAAEYPKHKVAPKKPAGPAIPADSSFDWSQKGATTPIYDQGQCGSCWAFSATETIESYWFLAGNALTSLSMEQVVDCDTTDDGCDGGWTYNAYQYVIGAGGIDDYNDYPYTAGGGQAGSCAFNTAEIAAHISSWSYVTQSQDEGAMMNWLQGTGPISVCVDASQWSSYQGGIVTADQCTQNLDHCVQLTGYGTSSGTTYWNVRNSWGADWGLNGYIELQQGTNTCGIANVPTVVSV